MNRRRGFSLLEVLVAMLVLGVGIVGITEGVTLALRSSKEAEVQTRAALLAAGRLETLRAEGYLIEGEDQGEFGADFPHLGWIQTVARTDLEGLYQVTVTVEDTRSGESIYELKTLLFDAPYSSSLDTGGATGAGSRSSRFRDRPRGGAR